MIHVGASLVGALVIFIRFHTGNVFMGTHKGSPYVVVHAPRVLCNRNQYTP